MPELKLDIDLAKAEALGVSQAEINSTLSTAWGSSYVNDFIDRGRVKKVYLQGTPDSRMVPEDLTKWYVRNNAGEMVPFSAFASSHWTYGSPRLERYNGFSAMEIQGAAAPGYSTGQAMDEMEKLIKQLLPRKVIEGFAPQQSLPETMLSTLPVKPKKPKKPKTYTQPRALVSANTAR